MPDIVIADTSCFIVLQKVNQLDLLRLLYNAVITTPEIAEEYKLELPPWVSIKSASDQHFIQQLQLRLDVGEASAIALALEIKDCTLVLDDLKARKEAEHLKLDFTGTLGLIVKAKRSGLIKSAKEISDQMKKFGIRVSEEVLTDILKQAGE